MSLWAQILCCGLIIFVYLLSCRSTKHLRRPKVKHRDEELSLSDPLTPKKEKTCLSGRMRVYLWAYLVTPTPQPHLLSSRLCKIKMCGSSKLAWIVAIRTTRYPLILTLCCDVFMFVVKQGVPNDKDLEWLYPSCLLYGKDFLKLFVRSQSRDINGMSPNSFMWRWQFLLLAGKNRIINSLFSYVGVDFFVLNCAQ